MATKYLPMGAKLPKPFPWVRTTIGVAGALTATFTYQAISEKIEKPISHEIVQIDPWSECIKDTADQAIREKLDFETLADTKCKGLVTTVKPTPA